MKPVRYVTLDPTGNTTCLVLDPVNEKDRGRVTDLLMRRCDRSFRGHIPGNRQQPPDPAAGAAFQ